MYGAVPPEVVIAIAPLFAALHLTLVTVDVIETTEEALTVTEAVPVQLLASLTVTVYVPAAKPVLFCVVLPLLQAKVYGVTPPDGLVLTDPLFNAQVVFVVVGLTLMEGQPEQAAISAKLLKVTVVPELLTT